MRVLGVIPARLGSTRFPGKVLATLGGKPLLLHVLDHAREARCLTTLAVAVDDEAVARVAREAGATVIMTPESLASGSDRVAYAADRLEAEAEPYGIVVNIQADEPFLPGEAIDRAVMLLAEYEDAGIATLAVPAAPEDGLDPHVVKVVLDKRGRALYFSRSAIPHGGGGMGGSGMLRHLGLYAFRRGALHRFVESGPGRLERTERLEQLRALEDGAAIRVAVGDWPAVGVDTREDLERARLHMEARTLTQRRAEA